MNQEGRGSWLDHKLKATSFKRGMDTVQANLALGFRWIARDYGVGARRSFGIWV